jgi:hypothetical protein
MPALIKPFIDQGEHAMKTIHRFFSSSFFHKLAKYTFVALVATSCTGCGKTDKKSKEPAPGDVVDVYGIPQKFLADVYTRPGTNIRIDFVKSLDPSEDFTPAEIAHLRATLDTLTNEELASKNIKFFNSYFVPQTFLYVDYTPANNSVGFIFKQPAGSRPLDPLLGFHLLKALGLSRPPTGISSLESRRVFNSETGEYVVPELDPTIPPSLISPIPIAPSNLTPQTGLPSFVSRPTEVISPNDPTQYVPLISRDGLNVLAAERRLAELEDIAQITTMDQIRAHIPDAVILPKE